MPERYVTLPDEQLHEFIIRHERSPGGSHSIVVLVRLAHGVAPIDRVTAGPGGFTESAVAAILASLTDAFMRELVITSAVRLAPLDAM